MQPPRYMTRSNSMAREKRSLDPGGSTVEGQPQRKRPAFSSVVVEALKVDNLQRLCSSLEPILRRVVSEEVERALAKLGPAKTGGRASPPQLEGPDGRNLRLQFRSSLSLPLFTGGRIEGEQGAAVHIVLMDANNGRVVTYGPESSVKINVVVLEGDFNNEENDNWTEEEFESYVVKEREGKRPLLTGDLQVTLKEGVGTLGEVTFTDNSSWIRSRKFRLGLKVASGCCEGIRIREAKTEPFSVKDHRGELYKKHYPPALSDEVWRLEKIGKDGAFHKRLTKAGIFTVKDFLRLVVQDSQRLRNILGSGMSTKMWDALVEHAKTCAISGKLYVYYSDDARDVGVVFNNIYVLCGLIAGGQYYSADSLSDGQRGYVDNLVKKAYENWMHVVEYDGESLLSFKQNKILGARQSEDSLGQQGYLNSFDHLQTLPCLPVSVPSEQSSRELGPTARGYNGSLVAQYPMQPQDVNPNAPSQLNGPSFPHDNQLISASDRPQLLRNDNALVTGFLGSGTSNSYSFRGVEGFSPEEEIRMRSHEMLGSEDMQHLLRLFNDGSDGHSSMNVTEDGLPFPSAYMPIPSLDHGFNNHQVRSSGKAVVGWLKLKAALRWGIFIRKKAAERRAQLVELN